MALGVCKVLGRPIQTALCTQKESRILHLLMGTSLLAGLARLVAVPAIALILIKDLALPILLRWRPTLQIWKNS